jgi:hyperosmotically inducible protein
MSRNNITRSIISAGLAFGFATIASLAQAPDNTKANDKPGQTADQAKNTLTDRQIMQNIRKSIMADKSLSTYAHNIKIISEHGKVTLKGPVHTEEESKNIEAKAVEVAGAGNVTDMLTVKGDK